MNEQNVKKRGWVKNAAIVFLAVMLVLTFFSETIMNRSLPEVAAMYATPGTITARIRGNGTVSANDSYEVIQNQTRTVREINVRVGNQVSAGDVLFTLADTSSEELEAAQGKLRNLLLDYERKVISASLDGDYARENRSIELKKEEIDEAQEKLTDMPYSEAAINAAQSVVDAAENAVSLAQYRVNLAETRVTAAENTVSTAQDVVDSRTATVNSARDYLNSLGGLNNPDTSSINRQLADKRAERNDKRNELAASEIVHEDNYAEFVELAKYRFASPTSMPPVPVPPENLPQDWNTRLDVYLSAFAQELDAKPPTPAEKPLLLAYDTLTKLRGELKALNEDVARLEADLNAVIGSDNAAEYNRRLRRLNDAESALTDANSALAYANRELTHANTARTNAVTARSTAQEAVAEAEAKLNIQKGYKADWQAANDNIRGLQRSLEDLLFGLSEQQKTDGVTSALSALEMRELRNEIERTREEIDKLEDDDAGFTIISPVSGIIRSINISPGNQTQSNTPLAVIEVVDRGYSLSFTVTAEQARRVSIGDPAEVSRGWWGSGGETFAVLRQIRNDPQNPAQSRILEFEISGEVESGSQLNIILGQRSANFEVIVPNSALRSDTNGDFVLVVLARSSPLGNRYVATRVDVNVLASDDLNSAISGGLSGWDFVITTSTKPIEPGMQVRLVDNPW